jgi:hypothetical protein
MKARTLLTKILKGLAVAVSIVLLYALAGFYAVPYLVQSRMPSMIKELTGREASIAKVELNPFSFRMSVHGFALQEKNGQLFASFERFAANLELWRSLKESTLTIEDGQLLKPFVRLARFKNGQFNFADLLPAKEEPPPEDGRALFPVRIDRWTLADGKLLWEDGQSGQPVKEEVVPIDLTVEQFSSRQNQPFALHLTMVLKSGGVLDWQGEAGIEPLFSKGRLKLERLKLQMLAGVALPQTVSFTVQGDEALEAEYRLDYSAAKGLALKIPKSRFELKDFAYTDAAIPKLAVKSSAISLEAGYQINYGGQQWRVAAEKAEAKLRDAVLTGFGPEKAALKISEIVLAATCGIGNEANGFNVTVQHGRAALRGSEFSANPQDQPLVKIGRLAGEGIDLDLLKRTVSIKTLQSENADIQAWLTKEGKLNYLVLLSENGKPATTEKAALASTAKTAEPWTIALKSAALTGFGVNFEDRTGARPVAVQVKPIDLTLRDFANAEGTKLPVRLSAGFNQSGRIKLDGHVVLSPFAAHLKVSVADIALDRFQTYVDRFARLDVIDGGFFAEGRLDVQLKAQPDVKFHGIAGVEDWVTRDQLQNKDFIKWQKLTLDAIDADLSANRYTAKRLLIEKPYARVVIRKDKTVNVNEVLSTGTAGSQPAAPARAKRQDAGHQPYFRIDQVRVRDGSSDFADLSLILPFAAEIQELNGGATGFSSEKQSKVKVSLKGNAYDLAPVDVQGEVSPYRGEYDVQLSFHGLPMPLVSPYMVQFAGYKVEKGKLNLDLKYRVEKGALTASNNILIDQFELGEKVENPNAVSLPLDLAVALLKDSDNRIKLDVPITGSLDDPKFSVRALVADALLNALKKVIASPFKAVASLFKDGENLDHVDFKAGQAELDQAQLAKLDNLAKALKERPALNLEVKGAAYVEQDWPALKDAALYDQLKRLKAAEIAKKGKKVRAEYIELSEGEYKDYLAQMFIEKFPLLAERSLFGKPRLIDEKAGDFYAVAKQKLFTIIKPEVERLKDLAAKRAQVIAKYVVQQGGIPPERVFILDTAINPEREGQAIVSRLSLKAR